ncbi:MAG: pyridoxamine 5'-phosphate oxidase family protein [Nitriliruptorales bacterium]|nr:pyridoxamine 5'-phosphate oxidase family protein [Nitriliruptorales bacterium]
MSRAATGRPWIDQHGLGVLEHEECIRRLEASSYGRVAYMHGDRCLVLPVIHVVVEGRVVFRSSIGTKLGEAATSGQCSFQVDHYDPDAGGGWSVLVCGTLSIVRDASLLKRLEDRPLPPVPGAAQGRWVALEIEELSGRELQARR